MGPLVRAFLGQPGSGKTYVMSALAYEWARRHDPNDGWAIFSTYELQLPFEYPIWSLDPPGDDWGPVISVLEAERGLLLIDEAGQFFNSRLFGKTPAKLLQRLMQVRKHRLELWWASQHLEYVDKQLRLLTFESFHCGSLARSPVFPGFFVTTRNGLTSKAMGLRYLIRTKLRDGLYDTMKTIQGADYYEDTRRRSEAVQA
jgi:hypothetical protein